MTDKKLIAEFMGLTFVKVGYEGQKGQYGATKWQEENQKWFDKFHGFHDDSVGDYAVNVKKNKIYWQSDLKYKTDWNWLIPVVEKIESLGFKVVIHKTVTVIDQLNAPGYPDGKPICWSDTVDTKLGGVYTSVVKFIKWYNNEPTGQEK